mmetsp:Transcript_56778/g.114023  ORF Transcript_56778/g.114023 Transcript_56778/m.114023 type:complete len:255 (+) Transcript_56778:93-857(+)
MGLAWSFLCGRFAPTREARLVMVGLDAAGKTTILHRLRLGEVVETVPTIGFNVETVEYGRLSMTIWDVGGQEQLRRLWRHYYSGTQGVVFVLDSADRQRLKTAREELKALLEEPALHGVPLLVYANKQDLEAALSENDVVEELCSGPLMRQLRQRQWLVQPSCATSGEGLYEGLDWLSAAVQQWMDEEGVWEAGPVGTTSVAPPQGQPAAQSGARRAASARRAGKDARAPTAVNAVRPIDGATLRKRHAYAQEA